ncbi:hypothetical protein [Mycolicibacterium lacusdiani]|uniref:hypothetical protein n=1 Tax=Mycolicibacterium lacusdiani TaxID=2895283 RepID=UPI001F2E9751|nr:hypothetical protein [Mycolicibacterium lacusdiani]
MPDSEGGGFPYCEPDTAPSRVPGVRNPFEAVEDSEFGVGRGGGIGWDYRKPGHQERLARRGVGPADGGPHRPLSPGIGVTAGRQSGTPGKRIAP